jgi:hypothetical protein
MLARLLARAAAREVSLLSIAKASGSAAQPTPENAAVSPSSAFGQQADSDRDQ